MIANATAKFLLQRNFKTYAKTRKINQCAWGLC